MRSFSWGSISQDAQVSKSFVDPLLVSPFLCKCKEHTWEGEGVVPHCFVLCVIGIFAIIMCTGPG